MEVACSCDHDKVVSVLLKHSAKVDDRYISAQVIFKQEWRG